MSLVKKKTLLAGAIAALMAMAAFTPSSYALDPGYRMPDPNYTLVIDTTKGQVIAELYPSLAPNHVERMLTLTRQKFYDGLTFHRVIEDFMAQTGDPKGDGTGDSTLPNLNQEFVTRRDSSFPMTVVQRPPGSLVGFVGALPVQSQVNELMAISTDGKANVWGLYCQGVLGMAHSFDPNSGNSQFFLMRGPNSSLEKHYTAFGVVLTGLDAVRKLKIGEPPVNPDKMNTVRVLADIPEAERPQVEVMDTASTQFQAVVDAVRKDKGDTFSDCDIAVPAKILNAVPATADAKPPATSGK
jgi:peptidylprolyl isomerase